MSKNYLAQVFIPHDNGIVKDGIVNTFSFIGPDIPQEPDVSMLKTRLTDFYSKFTAPATVPLTSFLSVNMNPPGAKLKVYRRDDVPPRVPVIDTALPLSASGNGAAPHEVSLVISFRAAAVSGTPQARRRGRIYLGPLADQAIANADGDGRPTASLINAAKTAPKTLALASDALWTWVVWSSLAGPATIVAGWVDNSFDTQRRRGLAPTVRTIW